jgi:3-oxoacyl-[acyl-carrier protein] reductase
MTADEFISQFDVDVFGGFNLCKSVIPIMKKGEGGTLIAITSSVIESSGAQMGAYTSAKFAVQGMLREFARELAADSIRVYAVAPGLLKTELTADLPERYFEFVEKQRGTHLETTEEVARLCMELSEGKSETGTSHSVNGGIGIPL